MFKYVIKNIKKYLKQSRGPLMVLFLMGLMTIPLGMVSPVFFGTLVDTVMYKGDTSGMPFIISGLVLVYLCGLIGDSIGLYCSNKIRNNFLRSLRKDTWEKISGLGFASYEKYSPADLKMRVSDDVNCLGNFIKEQVYDYGAAVITALVSLAISLYINWQMTTICLAVLPVLFVVNNKIGGVSRRVNEEIRRANDEYYSFEHDSLQMWKEVKLQSMEGYCIERFGRFRKILARLGYKDIRCWLYREVLNDFRNNYFSSVFIYGIGAFYVMNGKISVGMLFAFARYINMFMSNTGMVNDLNAARKANFPYYKRIFETLGLKGEQHGGIRPGRKSKFELKNISFSYKDDNGCKNKVIRNFNLKLKPGNFKALSGRSGCGKTTVVKILTGLYKPDGGRVLVDGVNLRDVSKESFYENIGVVMQDAYLFNMTIRENLCIAKEDAAEEEMEKACIDAGIFQFIQSLEDGFDTVIGERGVKLSGGQRQRLAIARALIKKPGLLVLDEATSSLDGETEEKVLNAVKNVSKNTAVLMISHKPSAVERAGEVIGM